MRAVAHGWKPTRMKGPSKDVAKEFVAADQKKKMAHGGLAQVAQQRYANPNQRMNQQGRGSPQPGGALQRAIQAKGAVRTPNMGPRRPQQRGGMRPRR